MSDTESRPLSERVGTIDGGLFIITESLTTDIDVMHHWFSCRNTFGISFVYDIRPC